MGDLVFEAEPIIRKEIETVIKLLPTGKACGKDNIAAELLQGMGDKGRKRNGGSWCQPSFTKSTNE